MVARYSRCSSQSCSQCNAALDAYGHHALCCKLGGDVVSRHNTLRDIFNDFCHFACLAPQLETQWRIQRGCSGCLSTPLGLRW